MRNASHSKELEEYLYSIILLLGKLKYGPMSHLDILNTIRDQTMDKIRLCGYRCETCQKVQMEKGPHKCVGEPVWTQIKTLPPSPVRNQGALFAQR